MEKQGKRTRLVRSGMVHPKEYSTDFVHLKVRSLQSDYTGTREFTKDGCIDLLKERIKSTKIEMVKADVSPFVRNMKDLDVWSTDYFIQLADMVKYERLIKRSAFLGNVNGIIKKANY